MTKWLCLSRSTSRANSVAARRRYSSWFSAEWVSRKRMFDWII